MKHIRTIALLVACALATAGCKQEVGSPISSIPVAGELLPHLEPLGYTQELVGERTQVSKNGIPLWSYNQNCYRYCSTSYIGPRDIYAEISEDFRVSYVAALEALKKENLKLLGLAETQPVAQN